MISLSTCVLWYGVGWIVVFLFLLLPLRPLSCCLAVICSIVSAVSLLFALIFFSVVLPLSVLFSCCLTITCFCYFLWCNVAPQRGHFFCFSACVCSFMQYYAIVCSIVQYNYIQYLLQKRFSRFRKLFDAVNKSKRSHQTKYQVLTEVLDN